MSGIFPRIILYNTLIFLAALVMLPWTAAQLLFAPRRRTGLSQRLGGVPESADRPLWIHAVSVGEVRAVTPMLDLLSRQLEGKSGLFLSTVTVTGQNTALAECEAADEIFYFPMDLPFAVGRALDRVRPTVFVMAETEIWPNFLYSCIRRGIPIVMVNGRISDRSFKRYLNFRWFFRPILDGINAFLMQSEEDARRIIAMGAPADRVFSTGNTKHDRKPAPAELPEEVKMWADGRFLLVAGSTHKTEEETVLSLLSRKGSHDLLIALVPRHPERFEEVAMLLVESGVTFFRYSDIQKGNAAVGSVILVDTMGVLESFYSIADAAFVGGSLVPVGGHNLLEPAAFGIPVVSGPHLENFREISDDLIKSGGCVVIEDSKALAEIIQRFSVDEDYRLGVGASARGASEGKTGASARNVDRILSLTGRVQ